MAQTQRDPKQRQSWKKTVRSRRKFFLGSSSLFINCPFNLKKFLIFLSSSPTTSHYFNYAFNIPSLPLLSYVRQFHVQSQCYLPREQFAGRGRKVCERGGRCAGREKGSYAPNTQAASTSPSWLSKGCEIVARTQALAVIINFVLQVKQFLNSHIRSKERVIWCANLCLSTQNTFI